MHGLVDPILKLDRAKTHLDALDSLLQDFTGDKAYILSHYDDLQAQRHVLRCTLLDVPDPICLTAGDAFYNMRSCLDQLVWSLAKRVGGIVDPEHTQFPILEANNAESRKRFRQQTDGVPPAAADEIKSLQPYHRGASYKLHPLWRLNAMCNIDKHRRIPANGSELTVNFPKITADVVTAKNVSTEMIVDVPLDLHVEPHDDGTLTSVPIAFKDKLQTNPKVAFKVNFGGDTFGFSEDRGGIQEIYEFIRDTVLPRFIRFFNVGSTSPQTQAP